MACVWEDTAITEETDKLDDEDDVTAPEAEEFGLKSSFDDAFKDSELSFLLSSDKDSELSFLFSLDEIL
jgi:hypothetical protein